MDSTTSVQSTHDLPESLPREAARELEALEDCLRAVGRGERELRVDASAASPIAAVASAANEMIDELVEAEGRCGLAWEGHRELMAAVSHDLRTPVASLRLLGEAIGEEPRGLYTERYARQLLVQLESLETLVGDLFELSRLRGATIDWTFEELPLRDLVLESVEAMEGHATRKGVALGARLAEDLPPVRANPEKLQRVLFNLLANAIRHTPVEGTVTVAVQASAREVRLEVVDTGEGVAPLESARLFDRFYQGAAAAAHEGAGAGLGLAICRAIVEAHGGVLWLAESERGARMCFTLQRTRPEA